MDKKEKNAEEKKPKKSMWGRRRASRRQTELSEPTEHLGNLPLEGLVYKTRLTEKYLKRSKYKSQIPGTVYSAIPGTVKSIAVKIDQQVNKGDLLAILDAMKMNNEIVAPYTGTITEIHVKPTQIIAKDVLMFTIACETAIKEEVDNVSDDGMIC
jgi:biotin carboxyl carrier protein